MKYDFRRQINDNCCVPACLQMILSRKGFELKQEDIFNSLPHKDDMVYLNKENIEFYLSGFNLKVEYLHRNISFIPPDEIMMDNPNSDFMVAYYYNLLHDKDDIARHVSLVEKIDSDYIYLLDPKEKIKKVEYKKLSSAMPFDWQCGVYFIH